MTPRTWGLLIIGGLAIVYAAYLVYVFHTIDKDGKS